MDLLGLGDPARLDGEGIALTIAASAAVCAAILALIAAGSVRGWGERLGFVALAILSVGAAVGFWRVSSEVTVAFVVWGCLGALLVLIALRVWDRLRRGPDDEPG